VRRPAPQLGEQHQTCPTDPPLPELRVPQQHQLEVRRLGPVQPAQRVDRPCRIELELLAVDGVEILHLKIAVDAAQPVL
jgi:hypothetical protein